MSQPKTYYAEIDGNLVSKARKWRWSGESPRYVAGQPNFLTGDKLYVRVAGCFGKHTVTLELDLGQKSPFEAPHDTREFKFGSDEALVFSNISGNPETPVKWAFNIRHEDSKVVDPEFVVTPGGRL